MEGMYAEVFLELQKLMNFSFLLKVPPDQQYGSRLADGAWNGMIGTFTVDSCCYTDSYSISNLGMILNGDADMSSSDFTLSKERAAYVDFLTPLTETHLRLIIKNPSDSTNWGAYINPLTWQVQ